MTRSEYPPITNTPEGILSAWTALEVLSPPTFTRPEELALNRWDVVQLGEKLPWESGAKSKPSYKLYFQVILGTVKLEPAVARLIERYADTRPDPPSTRDKKAILAAVIVDRAGRLIESPAVAVSSFAWGVMTALNGDLADLARWPIAERDLVEKIDAKLRTFTSGEESERPLTHEALLKTYQALVDELRLPQEFVEPPTFAIRSYVWFKDPNPPEPVILNSFFLADLDRARREFADGRASENLQRYLGSISPETRIDLLQDEDALREVIAPTHTPIGRWPSRGRRSLVMLQQAAVNLAFKDLHDGAILGVNGPPGTGKTTLLRDVVAGAVTDRAAAMVKFADPETAFTHSGERVKAGQSWLHLYSLVPELRGHEIVVASSNNKAVENVSAELPALSAIAADAPDLRYFKCVADVAHDRETWGMIAAVLGNAQNRGRFRRTFWWDEEVGMSRYLAAAAGTPQVIEEKDAATGTIKTRLPRVVAEERPPTSKQQALKQWKAARTRFKNAVEESRRWQAWLENLRRIERDLPRLTHAVSDAEGRRTLARAQKSAADMRVAAAERERQVVEASRVAQWSPLLAAIGEIAASVIIGENVARVTAQEAQRARLAADDAVLSARTILNAHAMRRPGLWARTFNTRAFQHWNATAGELTQALATAQTAAANTYATVAARESEVSAAAALRQESERTYLAAEKVVKGDHSSFSSVLANRYADTLRQSAQTAFYADSLNPFLANCRAADDAVAAADRRLAECRDQVVRAGELLEAAERDVRVAQAAHQTAMASLDEARSRRVIIPNKVFFAAGHDAVHRATVWYPDEAQRARDEVFSAAIAVHRAFIGAAAKPLRHNLGALISNQGLTTERKRTLIPDLWASLFLVVPMVSTTFASVERMLHDLPPQSLGWLLVDEAGQALPQAAVGALMRTRKALVIGDPMQIEPIVLLPDTLTTAICRHMGVEPEQYAAPAASVQTLADAASRYVSEFQTRTGSREVGVPLLVHRRCSEPMFGISNAVAYANLMVTAKEPTTSAIRDALGPSAWLHVDGSPEEKWCPEEGREVLRLLRDAAAQGLTKPDLFIITPFRIVQDRLRQLVREDGVLAELGIEKSDHWKWTSERIGTVHTVQGREAEAVIFVLGAPSPSQAGARNWAGGRPNLLNVAVSRAKEALYIVGNRRLWREAGLFSTLAERLP